MEVKKNKELSRLCHQTKNLYNRANFLIKEQRKTKGSIPAYFDLDRTSKGEECYRVLPAHTAQHTLKLLSRNWKTYFRAMKEWKKNPQKFLNKPCSPHFKRPRAETAIGIGASTFSTSAYAFKMLQQEVKINSSIFEAKSNK